MELTLVLHCIPLPLNSFVREAMCSIDRKISWLKKMFEQGRKP
jgi:hypothetical protein